MTDVRVVAAAQADDGNLSYEDLIAQYESGADELRDAVARMTLDQLQARPIPGKFSSLEVVCHVADCEQFLADRMKRTAAMDRPLLMGAEGFRYPAALSYQQHDLEEEIQVVAVNRRQMVRVLRLLPAEAWQRTAVHSETGLVTLRQLLLHAVRHLRHHVATIQEKRIAMNM
jgi:uncharacterized damage-inducible protein DinB